MERKTMFSFLSGSLLAGALLLQTIGVTLPFYQLYTPAWMMPEIRVDVVGYQEPIFLLFYAAAVGLVLADVFMAIASRRGIMADIAHIVPHSALLSIVPLLVVILASIPHYYDVGVGIPEANPNIYVILMPGTFVYMAGCALLILLLLINLLGAKRPILTSGTVKRWLAKNRIGLTSAVLLLAFPAFTLLRQIDIQTMQVIVGGYLSYPPPSDVGPLIQYLVERIGYLLPPILLFVAIILDVMLILGSRRASSKAMNSSSGTVRPSRSLISWIVWMLPLTLMLEIMFMVPWRDLPTPLVSWTGFTIQSVFELAYIIFFFPMMLATLMLSTFWLALILWIIDLSASRHLSLSTETQKSSEAV